MVYCRPRPNDHFILHDQTLSVEVRYAALLHDFGKVGVREYLALRWLASQAT